MKATAQLPVLFGYPHPPTPCYEHQCENKGVRSSLFRRINVKTKDFIKSFVFEVLIRSCENDGFLNPGPPAPG